MGRARWCRAAMGSQATGRQQKKKTLGSAAPNCCRPVPRLMGSQRPMGSGNGRSLSELSTEPRRRWRIYEPRRGSSLPDSRSLRGGEKTRLLLSSTLSIPQGKLWLGDIPGLWCPPPARLRDAGMRQGGPYPWGWCQTPAGCSTRGCRTSCRTRTRWLPARSRDVGCGGLTSSPAKPHRLPPETPRGAPITAAQCPCGMMGTALLTLPAKQRVAFGVPGDPSVPDAPLATVRAEKNIGGLWTCVHPLSIG